MHGMRTAFAFVTALVGLTSLASCTPEEPEDFGTVRIEISPLGGAVDMYNGTTEIVATIHYETCLQEFYLQRKPSYQQDGPEGAAVFEEWSERLCSDFDKTVDCEVELMEQVLLELNNVYTLRVTYKINDPSTIAYRELHIGPIPVEGFAECGDGQRPRVELQQAGLVGRDSQGGQLWRISTLPGQNVAVANQGAPLRVETVSTIDPNDP
jgi:hypothetical protein